MNTSKLKKSLRAFPIVVILLKKIENAKSIHNLQQNKKTKCKPNLIEEKVG